MDANFDTLIIGAGLAGLSAAKQLASAGRRVMILEARDRIGGRINSIFEPSWPIPIESGAEVIHGELPELDERVRQTGGKTYAGPDEHWRAVHGRLEPFDFAARWQPIADRLRRFSGPDISFARFMTEYGNDVTHLDRELARSYVEGFNAADAELVSADWL